MDKIIEDNGVCIFPAMGYWEMSGEPVSSKKARSGLHPDANWIRISHSECCLGER